MSSSTFKGYQRANLRSTKEAYWLSIINENVQLYCPHFSLAKSTFQAKCLQSDRAGQPSMLVLHMIICLSYLLTAVDAQRLKKYSATTQDKDVWPRFIYRTLNFNRKPYVSFLSMDMQSYTKSGILLADKSLKIDC